MFGGGNNAWGQNNQQQQQQQQQQPQQGGLFGGGAQAGGGFGGGGFGAAPATPFGQPAQPQQNSIFGGGNNTPAPSTFGGFGASSAPRPAFGASAAPAFGAQQPASGSLFGSNNTSNAFGAAPAAGGFGAPAQPSGGVFGGGGGFGSNAGTSTGGFGSPAGGGFFGAPKTAGFGGAPAPVPGEVPANGTASPAWQQTQDGSEPGGAKTNDYYQTITSMPEYKYASLEELRLKDYEQNRKGPQQQPANTFGAPAPASTFGGFGSTPQQQPAQGGLFGSNNQSTFGAPKPAGGLFGSTPSTTPAFGQPAAPAGGMFGAQQPAAGGFGQPAAPASTFGGFGTAQQQPPKTTFGFGSTPQPAFGTPAAAPQSTFGGFGQQSQQQQQPAQSTFGGFAATPAPASTGLFGASPAPASGGLFGAQPPKPAGTGLFGSTAPAPASGGLFGAQPASGGLFGSQPAPAQQSTGLFGSAPAPAAGGMFGQPQQPAQQQQQPSMFGGGGGMFGAAKPASPAPTGGLFGSQPAPAPAAGGMFGGGGGLFGSTNNQQQQQPQAGGLFGAAPKPAGGMFGSTLGGGGGGMFGSQLGQSQQQQQQQPQQNLQASIDQNPYGRNPLFENQSGPALPMSFEISSAKKAPLVALSGRSRTPQSTKNLTRLRGFAASPSMPSFSGGSPGGLNGSLNGGGRGSPARLSGLSDDASVALSPNAFVSRSSVKKLVLDRRVDGSDVLRASQSMGSPALNGSSGGGFLASGEKPKVTFDPSLGVSNSMFQDTFSPARRALPAGGGFNSSISNNNNFVDTPSKVVERAPTQTLSAGPSSRRGVDFDPPAPASRPVSVAALREGDYYTTPSMEELTRKGHHELTSLSNFVVGRKGYGKVEFLEPVDLTSVPSLRDIPETYVLFRKKEVVVYPEGTPKPPRGAGLNVRSRITIYNCFPTDKATKEPIRDVNHPRMKKHAKVLQGNASNGLVFISWEAETGTWVFEVPHFTAWGYDSDEDEIIGPDKDGEMDDDESDEQQPQQQPSTTPRGPVPSSSSRRNQRSLSRSEDDDEDEEDAPPVATYGSDDDDDETHSSSSSHSHEFARPSNARSTRSGGGGPDTPRRRGVFCHPGRQSEDDNGVMSDESMDASPNGGEEEEEDGDYTRDDEEEETIGTSDSEGEGSLHASELEKRSSSTRGGSRAAAAPPPWGSVVGVEPRKVQVMQASFFGTGESAGGAGGAGGGEKPRFLHGQSSMNGNASVAAAKKRPLTSSLFGGGRGGEEAEELSQRPSFEINDAPLSRPSRKYTRVASATSLVKPQVEGVFADAGLMMGRSFRVGWGPDGTLVHMGKVCGLREKSSPAAGSSVKLDQIKLLSSDATTESNRSRRLLEVQLANTDIELDEGIPVATPHSSLRFRDFSTHFSADDQTPEAQLWRLGNALFDEIDLGLPPTASEDLINRVAPIRRKLALSKWLQSAVSPSVDHDLLNSQDPGPARVFTLLTGNQIEQAAAAALDAGDLRLATLVARIGGNQAFRDDVFLQLEKWREHRVDASISADYRKVYSLLAGIVDFSEGVKARDPVDSSPEVGIAEGLDWKRAFGLHLWFGASFDSNLAEGLRRYEHALSSSTKHSPAKPLPWYQERPSLAKDLTRWSTPEDTQDALFLLLNLAVDTATPLEAALDPSAFGPTPLDFRLPWHVYTVLALAMKIRDFEDREAPAAMEEDDDEETVGCSNSANALTSSYASQLEQLGLWEQATFVLLHLELPESRENLIKELLFRNVGNDEEKEKFVVEKLLVPAEWIAEAKANTANDRNDPYTRYLHLLDAKLYDLAATVVVRDLLPEAVLRDDHELIRELLEPLKNVRVTDWNQTGQVALDLIETLERLPILLTESLAAPDAAETDELARLSTNLPSLIRLLPGLFNDSSLQSSVVLSDTLSRLLRFGGALSVGKWLDAPPTIPHGDHLLESEELSLVQAAALDRFALSLEVFA